MEEYGEKKISRKAVQCMHPRLEIMLQRYPALSKCIEDIQCSIALLETTFRAGGKLLVCGNGGSAADCEHIAGELMKGFHLPRPVPQWSRRALLEAFPADGAYLAEQLQGALPVISLANASSLGTAIVNDIAADMLFAQQVYGYGKPGDALLAISTSGTSRNVLRALQVGKVMGLHCIGLGGRNARAAFQPFCDVAICTPASVAADVQEQHLPVYHAMCAILEETFFGPHAE
jgi:D-sedoheptulose 7-phosphate isomerase